MFIHVTKVEYLREFLIRLTFSDGLVKEVDLHDELHGKVFEPLKDLELFRQVRLNEAKTTIEWPNGADFAPEYLHEIGTEVAGKKVA
jgi:hypothetical protein